MKAIKVLLCTIMFIGLLGCGNKITHEDEEVKTFKATIIECDNNSMIVKPNEDEEEYKSSDKFRINFVGDFNTCNINDSVKITYNGNINESYPAQIGTTKIEIIK